MSEDEWVRLSVKRKVLEEVKKMITERKDLGYTSLADFATDAIRRRLDEIKSTPPRFEHLNTFEDHATIIDRADPNRKRVVNVYFKEKLGAYCELCDSGKCDHVRYVWSLSDVIKALMKKGFKEPDFA